MWEWGRFSVQAHSGQPAFVDFRKEPMCGDANRRRNVMGHLVPVSPGLQCTVYSGTPFVLSVTA